ncbi:MAG: glycosyltransferase, partial [Verrucomicrobiota bacterium]
MHYHFIIPAYNESQRLPSFLKHLLPEIEKSTSEISFRVVDDGSSDPEKQQLSPHLIELESKHNSLLETLYLKSNLGKGGAVYQGWNACPDCDYLGFIDADGSIQATELLTLVDQAEARHSEAPSLFASRV